jgi:hypothetical protein
MTRSRRTRTARDRTLMFVMSVCAKGSALSIVQALDRTANDDG